MCRALKLVLTAAILLVCAATVPVLLNYSALYARIYDDRKLPALSRYALERTPEVALVGSSMTFRLYEGYFKTPLRDISISGGSPLTGLAIIASYSSLPKLVLVETNNMSRTLDAKMVETFGKNDAASFQWFRPYRAAISYIAKALDINVRSISRKVQLLDGICAEAVGLLKDKMCPLAVFDVLRKMNPLRQIEAAELLINANNFSISYDSAILAGTPQAQLITPQTPKRLKGMTAEAIARMERELSRLQEAVSSIQDSYGQNHLHLTVVKGYLRKLIANDRVARYLEQYQPELLIEFQKIAEMTSTLPSEAA